MAKKLIASAQITITTVSDGTNGTNGTNGVGVKNTDVMYIITNSNITPPSKTDPNWKTTADIPTVSKPYVWSMIKTTLTNNNTILSEPVCISGQGVTNIIEQYAMTKDKVNHPAENSTEWKDKQPTWQNGYFIWTRSKITYKNPDKIEYINYYCDSSWQAIEDVEIGGRNLLLKTKIQREHVCSDKANDTALLYKLSVDYNEFIKNRKTIFVCNWVYEKTKDTDTPKGTFKIQSQGPLYASYSNTITLSSSNQSGTISYISQYNNTDGFESLGIRADNVAGKITIKEARLLHGDKDLGWIAAPEDKTDSDDIIGDINDSTETDTDGSPLQISGKKINIKGAVTFESLDKSNNEFGNMFEKDNNKTVIDGGYLKTRSVMADSISAYKLTVNKRKNNGTEDNPIWEELTNEAPTFMVAEDGNISASGTFKSFNYNESNYAGWMIDKDGNSVFNNTIVRGNVELPNAGITNHGGGEGEQLLSNSDFMIQTTNTNIGWDNAKNGTSLVTSWGSYNSGVANAKIGYHAHVNNTKFDMPVFAFINKNSDIGETNRWMATSHAINLSKHPIMPATDYTFSVDIYFEDAGIKINGGLYHKITGNDKTDFHSNRYEFISEAGDLNKWIRFTWTFKTHAQFDKSYNPTWYIYGYSGKEGTAYIKNPKLEIGVSATSWSPEKEYVNSQVRFWAGESYKNRNNAPFRVLQDGTIISERGEIGGTFTGEIQIGNIRISDKIGSVSNPSWGLIEIKNDNDTETVIKIGEQSSCYNSPVYFGPEVVSTDVSTSTIKIHPKEKSMKMQCVPLTLSSYDSKASKENKMEILGSSIDFDSKYKLQTNNTNTKIEFKGKETNSELVLQNENINSNFNLSVYGFGDFKEGVVIGGIKIQPAPDTNGIDFFAAT